MAGWASHRNVQSVAQAPEIHSRGLGVRKRTRAGQASLAGLHQDDAGRGHPGHLRTGGQSVG
jgi:hypothetical protein